MRNFAKFGGKKLSRLNSSRVARVFSLILTKIGENIPNNQQIYQMAINYNKGPKNRPNGHKIYQPLPLQAHIKIYPNRYFWFENIPSGNPELEDKHSCEKTDNLKK
jgi:hypothetical protein